jgi:hypothetical protein
LGIIRKIVGGISPIQTGFHFWPKMESLGLNKHPTAVISVTLDERSKKTLEK